MVPTLEAIRGGGGSVKVGTTGTIGALMSHELDSAAKSLTLPASSSSSSSTASVFSVKAATSRKSKPKPPSLLPDEGTSTDAAHENAVARRPRKHTASQIPMLVAGDASVEATPVRPKAAKRTVSVVEIVDIKCGNPDSKWMKSGLKKLGFSKLSDNNNG